MTPSSVESTMDLITVPTEDFSLPEISSSSNETSLAWEENDSTIFVQDDRPYWEYGYPYSNPSVADTFLDYSQTVVLSFLGIMLNTIALVLLFKVSMKGKTSSDIFLMSQLSFDLGSSITALFWAIGKAWEPQLFNRDIPLKVLCIVWYSQFIQLFFSNMSILNCTLLTLERYAKIAFPIMQRIWMSPKKAKLVLLVLVCFVILHRIIVDVLFIDLNGGLCKWSRTMSDELSMALQLYNFTIVTVIPMGIFVWCYSHMLLILHRRRNQIEPGTKDTAMAFKLSASQSNPSSGDQGPTKAKCNKSFGIHLQVHPQGGHSSNHSSSQGKQLSNHRSIQRGKATAGKLAHAERNLFITALLVNVSFIASNAPIRLYFLFITTGLLQNHYRGAGYKFMISLIYLNYCFHPVIYAFTLKKVRDKLMFWRKNARW